MSAGSLRDRLSALSRGELLGLTLLAALTLGGAGLWYVRSLPRPVEIRAALEADHVAGSPSPSLAPLIVHVAGWVRRPGVFQLLEGDRVIDAIEAAGGPRRRADVDALNLAAPLTDGAQVLVPRKGPAAGVTGAVGSGASSGLINVNTATAAELEELPGIGEVLAQAIIDHRSDHGPFTSVDQLEDVSGIGPVTLEDIRDLVTV